MASYLELIYKWSKNLFSSGGSVRYSTYISINHQISYSMYNIRDRIRKQIGLQFTYFLRDYVMLYMQVHSME